MLGLYLCVRFGNADAEEGADGADTNVLVRASSHIEAAEVADEILRRMPTQCPGGRVVEPYCHRVSHLGVDASGSVTPEMALTPWIGGASEVAPARYAMWCRGEIPGEFVWRTIGDVFGDYVE
jgi:hypothetical protein